MWWTPGPRVASDRPTGLSGPSAPSSWTNDEPTEKTRIVIVDKGRKIAEGTAAEIMTQTGANSLEVAFSQLTGGAEPGAVTADFLAALERV